MIRSIPLHGRVVALEAEEPGGTSHGTMFRKLRGLLTFALAAASWAAGPAAGQAPSFSAAKTFAHATILSGNPTTLTIRLQNTSKTLAVSTIGFADIFPPGMVLIPGLDPVFQCGGTLSLSGATVARRAG